MSIKELYEIFIKSSGVVTDSRKIKNNSIFISLKGANFNGNEFAKSAIDNGAVLSIVDEKKYFLNDENYVLVKDCLKPFKILQIFTERNLKLK